MKRALKVVSPEVVDQIFADWDRVLANHEALVAREEAEAAAKRPALKVVAQAATPPTATVASYEVRPPLAVVASTRPLPGTVPVGKPLPLAPPEKREEAKPTYGESLDELYERAMAGDKDAAEALKSRTTLTPEEYGAARKSGVAFEKVAKVKQQQSEK